MHAIGSEASKEGANKYAVRNRWASICPAIALAVGSMGMLAVLGWALDVPALKSILPGAVEMKANTAIALILAAMSLFLRTPQAPRGYHLTAPILAVIVAA